MLSSLENFSKRTTRPKQDIPFAKKDKEWAVRNNEYILGQYFNNNGIPVIDAEKTRLLRLYAAGKQPTAYYKERLLGKKKRSPNEGSDNKSFIRKGFLNVDFDAIFSVAPKYLYQMRGIFEAQDHEVSVQAVDTISSTKKDLAKEKLWIQKQFAEQTGGFVPKGQENIPLPRNRAELELYDKMGGFKLGYETAMEKVLGFTESLSDYPELKRKVIDDFFINNVGAVMDIYDDEQERVAVEYVDPKDLIIEYSHSKDFSNSRHAAIPQVYTITEIMAMSDLTEDELQSIANLYCGTYGNPSEIADNYSNWKIPVLHSFWKSIDVEHEVGVGVVEINPKKVRKSELKSGKIIKQGNKYLKKKKNMLIETVRIKTVYESQWIVGTEHLITYRKLKNIPFNYSAKEAILPIHAYKLPGTSMMERMRPILDQIQLAFLKLQDIRAKASPDGFAIELTALENVSVGGKKFSPLDLITLRTQTGIQLYRATTAESMMGATSQPHPITPLSGGYGSMLNDVILDMELQFQFLSDITGIDRVSAVTGSTNTQDSAAATKIAAQGTSTSLSTLYIGWVTIKERVAESIALRAENICINNKNKNKGYYNIIGEKGVNAIAKAGEKYPIEWGFEIIARDKTSDIQEVRTAATRAFEMGNIESSTYLFILNELKKPYNTSYMRHYLALKEGEAKEAQAQSAQAATQALEQKEINVNNMKTQAKIAEINAQSQADLVLEKEKSRLRIIENWAEAETADEKMVLQESLTRIEQEIADGLPPSRKQEMPPRRREGLQRQNGQGTPPPNMPQI